ncbi:MAG: Sua5/YciO/YrdC/YwlC family protein, partial [Betaproteobacteria bacterium AqS2]|nr:Sua5/YciO/YrdC/YwlC family protein [Betaproteobacteria bacterium AqS2]
MPRRLTADPAAAAAVLRAGGAVAFPTETVYGLGALAADDAAVARLYALKGRPAGHPLIVHLAAAAELGQWASEVPEAARALAAAFMPGPLTLLLPRRPDVAVRAAAGLPTLALRVPVHPA